MQTLTTLKHFLIAFLMGLSISFSAEGQVTNTDYSAAYQIDELNVPFQVTLSDVLMLIGQKTAYTYQPPEMDNECGDLPVKSWRHISFDDQPASALETMEAILSQYNMASAKVEIHEKDKVILLACN